MKQANKTLLVVTMIVLACTPLHAGTSAEHFAMDVLPEPWHTDTYAVSTTPESRRVFSLQDGR